MFHLNVSKVDLGAYVAMVAHACFKRMFQVFHLFQTYVENVPSRYFKSKSGVVGRHPLAAVGVPLWFTC
jgi:hypothetical protein